MSITSREENTILKKALYYLRDAISALVSAGTLTPSGVITAFAGTVAPSGHLLCDGTSYLRADYPDLVAVIKDVGGADAYGWGSVDGTHFNVPNMVDQFLRGAGGANGPALAATQADATAKNGLSNATSSVSGSVSRTGNSSVSGSTDIDHDHPSTYSGPNRIDPSSYAVWHSAGVGIESYGSAAGTTGMYTDDETHTHTIDIPAYNVSNRNLSSGSSTGGTWSFSSGTAAAQTITGDTETRPANIGVNYIIKV